MHWLIYVLKMMYVLVSPGLLLSGLSVEVPRVACFG